jgi:hypothetical protein
MLGPLLSIYDLLILGLGLLLVSCLASAWKAENNLDRVEGKEWLTQYVSLTNAGLWWDFNDARYYSMRLDSRFY